MKRFIIGAVAAAAAFASFSTPAHATHDKVCTPAVAGPPLCVSGYTHTVDETVDAAQQQVGNTQDAAWNAFLGVIMPVAGVLLQGYHSLDAIPEPLCAEGTPVCVEGLREHVKSRYLLGAQVAVGGAFWAMCIATRPECNPLPPI